MQFIKNLALNQVHVVKLSKWAKLPKRLQKSQCDGKFKASNYFELRTN